MTSCGGGSMTSGAPRARSAAPPPRRWPRRGGGWAARRARRRRSRHPGRAVADRRVVLHLRHLLQHLLLAVRHLRAAAAAPPPPSPPPIATGSGRAVAARGRSAAARRRARGQPAAGRRCGGADGWSPRRGWVCRSASTPRRRARAGRAGRLEGRRVAVGVERAAVGGRLGRRRLLLRNIARHGLEAGVKARWRRGRASGPIDDSPPWPASMPSELA